MIGTLDSQVIEKFKEFQKKTDKYTDLNIEEVKFKKTTIDAVIDNFIKGSTPKYSSTTTNTIVIKSGQARGNYNEFNFSKTAYLDLSKVKSPKYLQNGDILINTTGVGTAGRVTLFDLDGNYVSDSHITALRYEKSKYNQFYLLYFFINFGFKKLESMAEGSGGQIELSMEKVKPLIIPIPQDYNKYKSVDIQKAIVDFLDYSFNNIEKIRKNIDKHNSIISRLTKSLIPSVFKQIAIERTFDKYAKENGIDFKIIDIEFEKDDAYIFGYFFGFRGGNSQYKKSYYANDANKGSFPLFTGSTEIVAYIKPVKQEDIVDAPAISYNKDNDKGSVAFYHNKPFIVGGHHYALYLKEQFIDKIHLKYSYYLLSNHFKQNMYYQSKEPRANSGAIKKIKFLKPKPLKGYSSYDIQKIIAQFITNIETELLEKHLEKINRAYDACNRLHKTYLARTFTLINWSKE